MSYRISARLLVRGTGIENVLRIQVDPEADKADTLLVTVFIAVALFIILFIWLIISTRRKKNKILK